MDFAVAYLPTENNRATHSRLQTGQRRAGESLIDRLGVESSANFTIPLHSDSPRRIFRASSSYREALPHRFSPRIIGRARLERGSLKHSKLPPIWAPSEPPPAASDARASGRKRIHPRVEHDNSEETCLIIDSFEAVVAKRILRGSKLIPPRLRVERLY